MKCDKTRDWENNLTFIKLCKQEGVVFKVKYLFFYLKSENRKKQCENI